LRRSEQLPAAGPDRYRDGAKPWESYVSGKGAWRTAE